MPVDGEWNGTLSWYLFFQVCGAKVSLNNACPRTLRTTLEPHKKVETKRLYGTFTCVKVQGFWKLLVHWLPMI